MKRKIKLFFNQPNRERGGIREWMEGGEHAKLEEWLRRSKQKLETLFEAGEVPVVGWLQLAATMDGNPTHKRNLEAELDENGKDLQQVAEQIRNLLEKQEKLEKRNHLLLAKKKKLALLVWTSKWKILISWLTWTLKMFLQCFPCSTWILCSSGSRRMILTTTWQSLGILQWQICKKTWKLSSQKLWNCSGN